MELICGPVHSDANDVQKITMSHLADDDATGECFTMVPVVYLIENSVFDCLDGSAPGVR